MGRVNIVDFNCPVTIGGVRVEPGDYVFGDEDGVVIIPAALTIEVLEKAEGVKTRGNSIRVALEEGRAPADLYVEHGKFRVAVSGIPRFPDCPPVEGLSLAVARRRHGAQVVACHRLGRCGISLARSP